MDSNAKVVPPHVQGILLLSGQQSEEEATINLNAICKTKGKRPWPITFAFGPALQISVLQLWQGKPENVLTAQEELLNRVHANEEALAGQYIPGMETWRDKTGIFAMDSAY